MHIDGTFLGDQQPNLSFSMGNGFNQSLSLYQDWYDPSATVAAFVEISGCTNVAMQPLNTNLTPSNKWVKLGEGDYIGTISFDPLHPTFTLGMHLGAGGGGTSFADFSHTAGITFDLPHGLTFSSASGAFLTADSSAVPEPATWAMMMLGFGGLAYAMRRKSSGARVRFA